MEVGIIICAETISSSIVLFSEGGNKAPHVFPGVAVGDADAIKVGIVNSGIWNKVVTKESDSGAVLVGNDTTAHTAVADTVGWIEHRLAKSNSGVSPASPLGSGVCLPSSRTLVAGVGHVQVGNTRVALREENGGEDSILKLSMNVDCDNFSSFLLQLVVGASCSTSLQLSCIVGEREGSVISLALSLRSSTADQQS